METNTPTFRERLNARLEGRKIEKSEKGLALLDVLIGMAIFALIAIIAVSAISQYRARAYESGAVSDARQVGIAAEASYTDNNAYPADAAGLEALDGVNLTKDNSITNVTVTPAAAGVVASFRFCVQHTDGAWATYDSEQGGIVNKGRTGHSCTF